MIDWKYFLQETLKPMDGISFPRAYSLRMCDGSVGLQHRSQMSDVDSSGSTVTWKPLSGPVHILNQVALDPSRLRLVPRKPVPLDGLKSAISNLVEFSLLDSQQHQVHASIQHDRSHVYLH